MELIIVNSLPLPGDVVRTNGDVYHWYQTNDITFPFDPISPIDHGYFVLNFEAGPANDGFLPDSDIDGWVELDYLPIGLIEKELVLSTITKIDSAKTYLTYPSTSSTFAFGRSISNESSSIAYFNLNKSTKQIYSLTLTTALKDVEKDIKFSSSIKNNIINSKEIEFSISNKIDVSSIANFIDVGGSYSNIIKEDIKYSVSTPLVIDVNNYAHVFSDALTINLGIRNNLFSNAQIVSIINKFIEYTFTDEVTCDLTSYAKTFSSTSTITIQPDSHALFLSLPITVDLTYSPKIETTDTSSIDLGYNQAVVYYAPETFIFIPSSAKKLVNSSVIGINTIDETIPYTFSDINSSVVNNGLLNKEFSGITDVLLKSNSDSTSTPIIYSSINQINVNTGNKELKFSNMCAIDIAFTGEIRVLKDQEWIMLKRFGTKGWKFLSYLEYFDTTEISENLDITVASNIGSIFTNATFIDVIYDPVETTRVDRIIKYKDEQHTQVLEEMNITYASGILTRIEILQYSSQGILFRAITEDFEFNVLTSEVISIGFVVTDVGQFGALTLPITPGYGEGTGLYDVLVGDAVFINTSGFIERTDATDADKSQVTGFVFQINGQSAIILSSGIISGYTALTVGASYFLNPNLPGKITKVPPAVGSGNILKFIGTAIAATSLNIDLSQRMVIRTTQL